MHVEESNQRPRAWAESPEAQQTFAQRLRASAAPLLLCDYDGTLAPFREDKMQAFAYPGVAELLEQIAAGPTRLAFITGRPVQELLQLLPLAARCEIWGMHGRERYTPGAGTVRFEPSAAQREALDAAERTLRGRGYGAALERKAGSVAVHWRNLAALPSGTAREEAERAARNAFEPFQDRDALALLPFDGGLELRTTDRTKAHAAEALLADHGTRDAVFLGDDVTDEDAFEVVERQGGLGMLVREDSRPSRASYWLHPPQQLLLFLEYWRVQTAHE